MKKILFLFLLTFLQYVNAQTPKWNWAIGAYGVRNETSSGICTNGKGSVYVTGSYYSKTLNFGYGTSVLVNVDSANSIFTCETYIVKYNLLGHPVWAKSINGVSNQNSTSIAIDTMNQIYVTGSFYGKTITVGTFTLSNIDTSGNLTDIFLAKYDSLGNVLWAKSYGGQGYWGGANDEGTAVCVDKNGDLFMTGNFSGDSIHFGGIKLINLNAPNQSFFLVKHDILGNVVWAKTAGGPNCLSGGTAVAVNNINNIVVTGTFAQAAMNFGSIALPNDTTVGGDIFVAKYNQTGNVIWAKSSGGNGNDGSSGISTDAHGNCYITGDFNSPKIIFGSTTLINTYGYNVFTAKYDSLGNALWAKMATATGNNMLANSCDITTDSTGNSYVIGDFNNRPITFGNVVLPNWNSYDIYMVKYDALGNVVWAKVNAGDDNDFGGGICVDADTNVYVTGYFGSPSINFDAATVYNTVNNTTYTHDVFTANLGKVSFTILQTNVSCYTANNGNASVSPYGGTAPYTYLWSSGQTTYSVSALSPGSYTITVTDAKGKAANGVITIVQPGYLYTSFTYTSPTSCSLNDGMIQAIVSGGTAPYTYLWNTNATSSTINGLALGNYTLTLTDAHACIKTYTTSLNCVTTDIDEVTAETIFTIYPNPTSNQFIIKTNTTDKLMVDLYDTNGRHVFSENINDTLSVDVSNLNEGVYSVVIKTANYLINKKFVILH
ncbi:MAG TPA: T9SS type A sorting domain-containing protein [Bacteroidia bacterium]|jgi:hypothetical protein|nr:T9SS type A sorting domain-containing protein [Bacteroidia bacterium]